MGLFPNSLLLAKFSNFERDKEKKYCLCWCIGHIFSQSRSRNLGILVEMEFGNSPPYTQKEKTHPY